MLYQLSYASPEKPVPKRLRTLAAASARHAQDSNYHAAQHIATRCAFFTRQTNSILQREPSCMMTEQQSAEIERLWTRKMKQDGGGLPLAERHRNLEPVSAEFLHALAVGIEAKNQLEIGGSSGISTIALASAAQQTHGRLISLEIEPERQAESRETISRLGLAPFVDFRLGDAAATLPKVVDLELVLIDCEKEDYIRFFDMLRMRAGGVIVADNILSHRLTNYVAHVRAKTGAESVTLPVGKGLELTRNAS
jgi:predicted O-methyltransferase YrrM